MHSSDWNPIPLFFLFSISAGCFQQLALPLHLAFPARTPIAQIPNALPQLLGKTNAPNSVSYHNA